MKPRNALVAAGCVLLFAMSALAETPPTPSEGPVGRYQLTITGGTLYVFDTTNGHCWSKTLEEPWVDLGRPMGPTKPKVEKPLAIHLPQDKVELAIKQRRAKSIPGSDGRISIYVDDITSDQVLLSIDTDKGKKLLDDTSVHPGDIVEFKVADKTFYVLLFAFTNAILGDDVAHLKVSADKELLTREVKPKPANGNKPKVEKKEAPRAEDKVDPKSGTRD